jgi:hypothetical protein
MKLWKLPVDNMDFNASITLSDNYCIYIMICMIPLVDLSNLTLYLHLPIQSLCNG